MAVPTWQPGTLYQPGAIVTPVTMPAPSATVAVNGDFSSGATNWDFTGDVSYVNDGHGYGGAGCARLPGNEPDGLALNKSIFVVPPGGSITASCMIEQGASTVGATRGWVEIHWFDADDVLLLVDKGNEINDGRGGAWHKSSKTASPPPGAAYARAGIALWSVADHSYPIWGDYLQVSGTFAGLPDGLVYKAVQANAGLSGPTEPAWPPILGQTVVDNEVTWEAVASTRVTWKAEPLYVSGDTEPDWPTFVDGYVRDGTVNWRAVARRVEDPRCPQGKIVAIGASKVFSADDDIVPYSATVNPLDWSASEDAGYLPTGLQNHGTNPVAGMALYRGNLAVFNSEGFQLWQIDEDPANMALLDALPMGSTYHHAIAPVSNDLFFLSSQGVRTLGIAASSTNFQAGDVGMPIDTLVQAAMANATREPMGLYFPSAGQYWLIFDQLVGGDGPSSVSLSASLEYNAEWYGSATFDGDELVLTDFLNNATIHGIPDGARVRITVVDPAVPEGGYNFVPRFFNDGQDVALEPDAQADTWVEFTAANPIRIEAYADTTAVNARYRVDVQLGTYRSEAFVYSMTKIGGVGAWSRYVFPYLIDDWTIAGNTLALRSADYILRVDPAVVGDEVEPGEVVQAPGLIQWAWLDWGQPGAVKMVHGFDVVGEGEVSVSFGFDQRNPALFTTPYTVQADTVAGPMIPMPLSAASLSVRLTYDGTERWSWNAFALYVDTMGPMA